MEAPLLTPPAQLRSRLGPLEFTCHFTPVASVGCWRGRARNVDPEELAHQARRVVAYPAERVVLDLEHMDSPSSDAVDVLANSILAALRYGQDVVLVRCPEELYRSLRQSGVRAEIQHAASLTAATQGVLGKARTWEVHLQSHPDQLQHLHHVLAAIAREAGLSAEAELRWQSAGREAVSNAIVHGSPLGLRNHVRVAVSLEATALYLDVADRGPGFDPQAMLGEGGNFSSEHGMGLQVMRSLSTQVQFYRSDSGMLVRLKHLLQ